MTQDARCQDLASNCLVTIAHHLVITPTHCAPLDCIISSWPVATIRSPAAGVHTYEAALLWCNTNHISSGHAFFVSTQAPTIRLSVVPLARASPISPTAEPPASTAFQGITHLAYCKAACQCSSPLHHSSRPLQHCMPERPARVAPISSTATPPASAARPGSIAMAAGWPAVCCRQADQC